MIFTLLVANTNTDQLYFRYNSLSYDSQDLWKIKKESFPKEGCKNFSLEKHFWTGKKLIHAIGIWRITTNIQEALFLFMLSNMHHNPTIWFVFACNFYEHYFTTEQFFYKVLTFWGLRKKPSVSKICFFRKLILLFVEEIASEKTFFYRSMKDISLQKKWHIPQGKNNPQHRANFEAEVSK